MKRSFFATAPKGFEALLATELETLGAEDVSAGRSGVRFAADLPVAYRVCLWSRIANRLLLPLARFPAASPQALYAGARAVDWAQHMSVQSTLAVDCHCLGSAIRHSRYAALTVKDAIVDQFREVAGQRPAIERERPDLRINVFVERDVAQLSLDLSGESLHRRGYRVASVAAPLKENLAAALLLRSGWPQLARSGGGLVDLMCGSGTLPIEAALIAGDCAPGLLRSHFGFLGWAGHDSAAWSALQQEARERRAAGLGNVPPIVGYDIDRRAVRAALANVERAGLAGIVHIERRALADAAPVGRRTTAGLVAVNPPYGERLGKKGDVAALYTGLGEALRSRFPGWRAMVLAADAELGFRLGIRSRKPFSFFNGAIECALLDLDIDPARFFTPKPMPATKNSDSRLSTIINAAFAAGREAADGAGMLANRLRKNLRTLGRWAEREGISCYRLYDADLPEYACAVDLYRGESVWLHVQEYQAPPSIEPDKADRRLADALAVIAGVVDVPPQRIFLKVRRRQKGRQQYQKHAEGGRMHEVHENGCRFLVNFENTLDTGLFLDHRTTRTMIGQLARGTRFLNLFAYTGTATVCAARGGARTTTSVDLSRSYLDWARRNLELNGFNGASHQLVHADCLSWLNDAGKRRGAERFDLIFLDPPTFSNSKRMASAFDVQRDHPALIRAAARLLAPAGVLIFSTNLRSFRLDADALAGLNLEEISRRTIPRDFARNPRIHSCWRITTERTG